MPVVAQVARFLNHRLYGHRQPERRIHAELQSEETTRRHADNGGGYTVHDQGLAQYSGIAIEAVLPVRPADHGRCGTRRSELVFGRTNQTPNRRMHTERFEEVRGHEHAIDNLWSERRIGHLETLRRHRHELREDVIPVAEALVVLPPIKISVLSYFYKLSILGA